MKRRIFQTSQTALFFMNALEEQNIPCIAAMELIGTNWKKPVQPNVVSKLNWFIYA